MTNLAIKGIIAVQAMAHMSEAVGQYEDAKRYTVRLLFNKTCCFLIYTVIELCDI